MIYFAQVDKETKRVTGYSSTQSNLNTVLEIEIDSNNKKFEELLNNPFIFKFDETNNTFIKDVEYQNKLIAEKENRLIDDKKITKLTKELAKSKVDSMQKDALITMLIREQAKIKIEKMKAGA